MKKGTIGSAFLLMALPALLLAQTPEERIQAAIAKAAERGIPVSLLETKMAEGSAKGVPMERIAAAIEQREAGLERALAALQRNDETVPAEDLSVGADALDAGVNEAVLAELAEVAPPDRRAVAIAALTQLVSMGHDTSHALAMVTEALARSADALANLPAQAAAAGARGAAGPPSAIPAPGEPPGRGRSTTTGRSTGRSGGSGG